MKEAFEDWNPRANAQYLLSHINRILADYAKQGYRLTLRQLYYQLVTKGIIPNKQSEYKKLGNVVSRGRLSGYIDWEMIEDRARVAKSNTHWDSPGQILEAAADSYYIDHWDDQENYVEVWCEKDAVSNIILPVCRKWDVTFMANRGYSSQSAMYDASKRFLEADYHGDVCHLIYLGDHDPSGIDMARDIEDRLRRFHEGDEIVVIHRIALTMSQVQQYKPPTNPVKENDARYADYVTQYGEDCWELDALAPSVLHDLVNDAIEDLVDEEKWDNQNNLMVAGREKLRSTAKAWKEAEEAEEDDEDSEE